MRVKEAMTKRAYIIKPETTIREAAQMMRDNDCGYLPVGENDRLIGALTDRDIVVRAIAEGRDAETTMVDDFMTKKIQYCFEDDDLKDAAELMKKQQIRRLVVLNKEKRMTGILSLGNIATQDTKLLGAIESEVCKAA